MIHPSLHIEPFDLRNASQADYVALNALNNRIRVESLPDDPPIPVEEMIQEMQHIPIFVDVYAWAVWQADRSTMIGNGDVSVLRMENNQHIGQFSIQIAPEYRRQGLGRRLLALIVEQAQREQRRLLITSTNGRIPAGAAFMLRLGAQKGLEGHANQLVLADLDPKLIQQWLAQGAKLAEDFELGLWVGALPEERLAAIADLFNVMNTAPRDQLEVEDFQVTPERLREIERSLAARQAERWTMHITERATGKLVGFTDVFWHPNRPQLLNQGDTGVFPEYRKRGLGRWLKAAMLEKVLRERPQVKFVRTGNADSNAAMLKINYELGFKPYLSHTVWQVETEQVANYLKTPAV
ncbi:MAG: GNAT family N-acetyltransferase [Caldilineaceae bacterium]